jgi:3-phosphoshikimate 1-carboxyvinyltransferase
MIYRITPPADHVVKGEITLNSSKSIANRVLIIRALSGHLFRIENLSNADDTVLLTKLLDSHHSTLDAGAGGTTYRFLTAFLATRVGREVVLTGSERMQQRPIRILVDALRQLGADITYLKEVGFPPLLIRGKQLKGGRISIPANTSSQFISALLMIAPYLKEGLELELIGEIVSLPYIRMTLRIMEYFGANVMMEGNTIRVKQGAYQHKDFFVEADWSAASYFYAIVALADAAAITLHGLGKDSLQGDAVIADILSPWVQTKFKGQSVYLTKAETLIGAEPFTYDFIECPDLAQTVVAVLASLKINARLSGLKTLLIKETDRVQALHNELNKYGASFTSSGNNEWTLEAATFNAHPSLPPEIDTYEDHRMAMAFAPLSLKTGKMLIKEPMVVSKSYPAYWDDLKKLGFGVGEVNG